MDMKVSDHPGVIDMTHDNDQFLLNEGLEVLANYRSISNEGARLAVRQLIASLAASDVSH